MTPAAMPWWLQALVALLLLASSALALASAFGLARLGEFFRRMHVPALTATLGTWCVTLASMLCFGALGKNPGLAVWLIPILLSITVPVTTALLARAALLRQRAFGDPQAPPPVAPGLQADAADADRPPAGQSPAPPLANPREDKL